MYCSNCGQHLPSGVASCSACGQRHIEDGPTGDELAASPPPATENGTRKRALRRVATDLLVRLTLLAGGLSLVLWLSHLAADAQLGSALPHHSTLTAAPAGTPISAGAKNLRQESLIAFIAAIALGGLTVFASHRRALLAWTWGKRLLLLGALGIIYSEVVPSVVAAHPGAHPSQSALNGILRTASPALGLYIALAAVGFTMFTVGWFTKRLRSELARTEQSKPLAPIVQAAPADPGEAPPPSGAQAPASSPVVASAPPVSPPLVPPISVALQGSAATSKPAPSEPCAALLQPPTSFVTASRESAEEPALFCTHCGSSIQDTNAFCTRCGTKVRQPAAFVVGPAMAQPPPPLTPAPSAPVAAPAEPLPRPGLTKRAVTEQEATMCVAWAKGGPPKKMGLVASILLMGFGFASSFGMVPAVAEIPVMVCLVPISLGMTFTSRIRQRTVSTAAKTAFAIDVSGVPNVERRGPMVNLRIGQVVFVVPRGHAPKLARAAGTGEATLSCVVNPGKRGTPTGLLTATGGYMLDTPIPTRVSGL